MKQLISLFIIAVIALPGCSTLDPYTREEKTASATKGAGVGAAIGALLGIATSKNKKDRKKRALIGAGIGALSGGMIGNYMDQQEFELRKKLERTGVSVTRVGDNLVLNMPSQITFSVNRSTVKPQFEEVLESVGLVLKEYQSTMIEVAGHTDSTGSDSHNRNLSQQRARSVSGVLTRYGVEAIRLDAVGYGEAYPTSSNATKAGRALNRRVELTLIPIVQ